MKLRTETGRSALLFITERCPVGCDHCSVDSLPASPRIRDFDLFERLVADLAGWRALNVVGISGGEPFVERRGLSHAVQTLHEAGKKVVVYTSGVWARNHTPAWIRDVLGRAATVYLGFDTFHRATLAEASFIRAARESHQAGAWLVVQTIDTPEQLRQARRLLDAALGKQWRNFAEIHAGPLLSYGRGARHVNIKRDKRVGEFGACSYLGSPVVRFDGKIKACCNEHVIMGGGPDRLHTTFAGDVPLENLAARLLDHPVNLAISSIGVSGACSVLDDQRLAATKCASICDACWKVQSPSKGDGRTNSSLDLKLRILSSSVMTKLPGDSLQTRDEAQSS